MRLLLDTHIWVWSVADESRLTDTVREVPVTIDVALASRAVRLGNQDIRRTASLPRAPWCSACPDIDVLPNTGCAEPRWPPGGAGGSNSSSCL